MTKINKEVLLEMMSKATEIARTPSTAPIRLRKYLAWRSLASFPSEMLHKLCRSLGYSMFPKKVQGSTMFVNLLEDNLSSVHKQLFTYGIHEPLSTRIVKEELNEGMHVVDIGANIGYYALLEARIVGDKGWVYAVEPSPRNFSILSHNVTINGYPNISLHNIALGDKNGRALMKTGTNSNWDHISFSESDDTIEVNMTTLDNFLKDRRVDFVRMDVEGFEYSILNGMEKTLRKRYPLKMFLEFHPGLVEKYGGDSDEVLRLLTDYGFLLKYLVKPTPIVAKPWLGEVFKKNLPPIHLLETAYRLHHWHLFLERNSLINPS